MQDVIVEFLIEAVAGLVSVFIGVWLALVVDRRQRTEDQAQRDAELHQELERTMDTLLRSVVKNTAEAKHLSTLLSR